MKGEFWVEVVGEIIIARVRGQADSEILQACQEQVLSLVREAGRSRALYDALEMDPPDPSLAWTQRALDEKLGDVRLRRAIVVPNSKLALLARIAFGDGDYRVFYNDMVAAVKWLSRDEQLHGPDTETDPLRAA